MNNALMAGERECPQAALLEPNVFELFEAVANETPEAIAIIGDSGEISYGELVTQARQISAELQRRGIEPEDAVGVLMERTPGMVATLLAILHVGGAYVPLDPGDPSERNKLILETADCRVIVGHRSLVERHRDWLAQPESTHSHAAIITFEEIDFEHATNANPASRGGSRLAYILFTSGSTGRPKGVEIEHRSVINLLEGVRELIGFTPADRMLAASTIGFDISVAELFLPLISGGAVVLRDRDIVLDPQRLVADVKEHSITIVQTSPTVWSSILDQVASFPRLRVAISTGEAISPELARRMVGIGEQVWNLYGPTEATVWATGHLITGSALAQGSDANGASPASAPIGQPLFGASSTIRAEDRQPLPAGEIGELWLGGGCLARGYRGQKELTLGRFWSSTNGTQREYRTGDLACWNTSGELEYFGRTDDQIKIRGVRIEPSEIERALGSHPAVSGVAATWYDSETGGKSIVAAVVLRRGATPAREELHAWAETRLPRAMIPSRFLFLDALPLSPAGKTDRVAIRGLARIAPDNDREVAMQSRPLTTTEEALSVIWRRFLGLDTVALTDHFFAIGGDSLSAVKLASEIEGVFRISLPVKHVFQYPTLERLALVIDQLGIATSDCPGSPFVFPLREVPGSQPLFFCEANLKLAASEAWTMPCSLYAIRSWAVGAGFAEASTVAALAQRHVEEIMRLQPHGPYRIAGYSFGALVALEISRQLERRGGSVEFLFLLDPMQPHLIDAESATPGDSVERIRESVQERGARHLLQIARKPALSFKYAVPRLMSALRNNHFFQWMSYKAVHMHGVRPNSLSLRLFPRNRWPAFWFFSKRLAKRSVMRPYRGHASVVFSTQSPARAAWARLVPGESATHTIEAHHSDFFEAPTLSPWIEILNAELKALDGA